MSEIREGLVEVIGASIHYQVSGHGPTLLLLSPGDGDADVFSGIVPLLDGFTVVTLRSARPAAQSDRRPRRTGHDRDARRRHGARAGRRHDPRRPRRSAPASAPWSGSSWWPGIRIACRRSSPSSRSLPTILDVDAARRSIRPTPTSSAITSSIPSRCGRRTCRSCPRPADRRAGPGRIGPPSCWPGASAGRWSNSRVTVAPSPPDRPASRRSSRRRCRASTRGDGTR